jgi:hypothetical protein
MYALGTFALFLSLYVMCGMFPSRCHVAGAARSAAPNRAKNANALASFPLLVRRNGRKLYAIIIFGIAGICTN